MTPSWGRVLEKELQESGREEHIIPLNVQLWGTLDFLFAPGCPRLSSQGGPGPLHWGETCIHRPQETGYIELP